MKSDKSAESVKKTLKYSAYSEIKKRILSCEYAPGAMLSEEVLCADTGTSRTPVRDALSRLEQESLITIVPKKGILVRDVTLELVNAVYEARLLIEPYSLERYGAKIDPNDILRFYDETRHLITEEHDIKTDLELDDKIHSVIVNASVNAYLVATYASLQAQNQRLRVMSGRTLQNRIQTSDEEHLHILTYCLKRDWQNAALQLTQHLSNAKDASFQLLVDRLAKVKA